MVQEPIMGQVYVVAKIILQGMLAKSVTQTTMVKDVYLALEHQRIPAIITESATME